MSRINKQLNASNSNIYTPVFVESILKVNIPVSIYLKSADHFDDKYISSTSDSWVFDYSGSRCYAHFRQDKISNQLKSNIFASIMHLPSVQLRFLGYSMRGLWQLIIA